MVTRDASLPYSPTVLPYVVSGRSAAERVFLRDEDYFREHKVNYLRGAQVRTVAAGRNAVRLADGGGDRLRQAAASRPARGRASADPGPCRRALPRAAHARRRARAARGAAGDARARVVLGAGLIGMHAAENLAKARRRRHRRRECSRTCCRAISTPTPPRSSSRRSPRRACACCTGRAGACASSPPGAAAGWCSTTAARSTATCWSSASASRR